MALRKFVVGIRDSDKSLYRFDGVWGLLLGLIVLEGCGSSTKQKVVLVEDTGRSETDKQTSQAEFFIDADIGKQLKVTALSEGEELWSEIVTLAKDRKIDLSGLDRQGRSLPVEGSSPITIEVSYRNGGDDSDKIGSYTFTYDKVAPVRLGDNAWSAPADYDADGYTILIGEGKGESEKSSYMIKEDNVIVQLVRVTEKDGEVVDADGEVVSTKLFERSSRSGSGFIADGETEKEDDAAILSANPDALKKTYFDVRFTGVLGDRSELGEFYSYKIRLVDEAGNISPDSELKVFPRPPTTPSHSEEGRGSSDSLVDSLEGVEGLSFVVVSPFDERLFVRIDDDGDYVLEGSLKGEGEIYWLKVSSGELSYVSDRDVMTRGHDLDVLLGENGESDFRLAIESWEEGDRIWVVGEVGLERGVLLVLDA